MVCCGDRKDDVNPDLGFVGRVVAYVGDNSIQVDARSSQGELRATHPELLRNDEEVVMAFQGRGGSGRDGLFFTSQRILIKDVKGLMGGSIEFTSILYESILAYSVDTVGMFDADTTLKLWWSSPNGFLSTDFAANVDMMAIATYLNDMVLVSDSMGAHVPESERPQNELQQNETDHVGSRMLDLVGGDARQIDATAIEAQLKREPAILCSDENVEMAFKCGRDSFLFTSFRLLKIDVQGLTGKKIEYLTIMWKCIRAFSVQTAGSYFDRDAEMILFTNIHNMPRIEQDFRHSGCDVMGIKKFLANKLLGQDTVAASNHAVSAGGQQDTGSGSILAWLGNDSRQIDAVEVDRQFHSDPPVLQGCETVEMAFKGRRDLVLFTTKRLLIVDKTFWDSSKVEYFSVPWTTVQAFGVRSAGQWLDKDSEMLIWTDINDVYYPPRGDDDPPPPPKPRKSFLELDFQKDKVDLMAVHRYLSERCLRVAAGGYLPPEVRVSSTVMQTSPPSGIEKFLTWLGDDAHAVDAQELDQKLHTVNPMLQDDEHVIMAFKVIRDTIMFTTKRVLLMDVQAWTGTKIEWKSVPYTSVRAFAVQSAGSWDRDAEVSLFCNTYWINGAPGCVISQDLRKGKADIIAMQSLLAAQIVGHDDGSPVSEGQPARGQAEGMDVFLNWLSDSAVAISSETANSMLHSSPQILLHDETVDSCFQVGRDLCIFTTKRVLLVDVKGWTGQKVQYMTVPLKHIPAFSVKSAGMFEFFDPAFVKMQTDMPGMGEVSQNLSKASMDIWIVHRLLAQKRLPAVTASR
eukprot:TRINITY_DN68951_c0_g1_i1.p1 TRINITY_DN68951_c0_g1~~TRINITY_DN68951_c0_g1_i1.p1  ORF type:complete len:799 (+),score=140.48 TRINITY_DN68951_c0_g1_i1:72-2468(+)